jgi:hypothetical protein
VADGADEIGLGLRRFLQGGVHGAKGIGLTGKSFSDVGNRFSHVEKTSRDVGSTF